MGVRAPPIATPARSRTHRHAWRRTGSVRWAASRPRAKAISARVADTLVAESDVVEKRDAPDRDELLAWLRARPLLYHDVDRNFTLVHAGLLRNTGVVVYARK